MQYELSLLGTKTELKAGDRGEIRLLEGIISFFREDRVLFPRVAGSTTSTIRGFSIWSARDDPMSLEEAERALAVIGAFARLSVRITESDDLVIRFRCEYGEGIGEKFTKNDSVQIDEQAGSIRLARGALRRSSDVHAMEWNLYPLDTIEGGAWADLLATLVRQDLQPLAEAKGVVTYGVRPKEKKSEVTERLVFPNLQQTYGARKPKGHKPMKMVEESPTSVRKNLALLQAQGMLASRPSIGSRPKESDRRKRPRSA